MAFYTANYIKQLIKEEHAAVQKHIKIKGNDFRSFIDATIPFVLYLDIDLIRDRILGPKAKFINDLADVLLLEDKSLIIKQLDKAYIKLINSYINSSTLAHIDAAELEEKLNSFELSQEAGGIAVRLRSLFAKTYIIDDLSRKDKRVVILYPRFTTTSSFGKDFRKFFDYSAFSDIIDDRLGNSPKRLVEAFLTNKASLLQNIGHIEVEVKSSDSSNIIRGLVSPRLLQALVETPFGADTGVIARKFSKETGQIDTRLVVKKTFSKQKLVMELLVTHGVSIGTLESQAQNLLKAPKEAGFSVGKGLTKRIVENPELLLNLVTSKSITGYIATAIIDGIKGAKVQNYSSTNAIPVKNALVRNKVSLQFKKAAGPKKLPFMSGTKINPGQTIANLEALLRSRLALQIKQNMGTGGATNVLNYRSGRFAETATIERTSKSRAGMVSVFYNYMRNPYGTFSDGGKQQYPRSRDPKALISKSIREIGASLVGNRMRAVLV